MRSITDRTESAARRISARRESTSVSVPAPLCSINSRMRWSAPSSDIDVDQQRRVIGGQLALASVAVDERERDPLGERRAHKSKVDSHAAAFVEVAGAVVPPRKQPVLAV